MEHQTAVDRQIAERYLLNELDDEEREQFEEHFFTCADCADDIRAGSALVEGTRTLLRPEASGVRQTAEPSRKPWWGWLWSPVPAYAMAAVLAVALVIQQTDNGTATLPEAHLLTMLRPVTRGTPQRIAVAPGENTIHLGIAVPAGAAYICTFSRAGTPLGNPVRTPVLTTEQLTLALPVETFGTGDFQLEVRAADESPSFREEFEFTIQR